MRDLADTLPRSGVGSNQPPVMLEARGLTYISEGRALLSDVSLKVRKNRTTVLLGPNGAGKTLLLRLLHGLLEPTKGAVLWHGKPLGPEGRRNQAMVPQKPVLLRRSALANLKFALSPLRLSGRQKATRVREALKVARLDHLAQSPARRLSGGEQQRLCLARALALRPSLLLLDEPTASLDPASTQAMEEQMSAAKASGATLVLITHDAAQARRLGDDVAFLDNGHLTETGPLAPTIADPKSEAFRAWLDGRSWA